MRRYVISHAEMRDFEASLRARGVSEEFMMNSVATAIARRLTYALMGRADIRNLVLLAGPGHNGEDGYRVAQFLRVLPRDGGQRRFFEWPAKCEQIEAELQKLEGPTLIIDAIYGIGFRARESRPEVRRAVEAIAAYVVRSRSLVVAVDVPSGLDEHGAVAEDFLPLKAHATFCVSGPKRAQLETAGAEQSGELLTVDLGYRYPGKSSPDARPSPRWIRMDTVDPAGLLRDWSFRARELPRTAHKNTRGRVLVVGGSLARGGAARIAAEGAYRGGAGYVTVVEPPDSSAGAKDLIRASGEWLQRLAPKSAREWESLIRDHDAVVFGCGLPAHSEKPALSIWRAFLTTLAKVGATEEAPAIVVDGGGLAIFAAWRRNERTVFRAPLVFTPHPKEARDTLSALTGKSVAASLSRQMLFEKLRAELATRVGEGALLLKGAYPMIGALRADAGAAFNVASPRLATAGTGDALAGAAAAAALRLESRRGDDDPEARAMGALALAVAAQGRAARALPPGALAREIARATGIAMEEILRAL